MATEAPIPDLNEQTVSLSVPQVAGHTAKGDDEISLLDLFIVLAERKSVILSVTVTFAILAIIVSLVLPIRYTATVILLPPTETSSVGAAIASQLGSMGSLASMAGGGLGIKNPNEKYVSMFKSRTVEDGMVQRFGLMQEYHMQRASSVRKAFENHVILDGDDKDGLIHIKVSDQDPRRAAELANGYVDEFRALSEHIAITEAAQRRLFFERQLEQAKNNLAQAEEALKLTEQTTGMIELSSQASALIASAASLRAQIVEKEVEIQGMQTYATGQNTELALAQRELEGMRAQLAKLGGSENTSSGEMILPKGMVPQAGLEYVRKLRDVKYRETIFEIIARQYEIAKLDEAKEGAVIQVVDAAVPPDIRSFPKRGLIMMGATAVGFIVGIFAALALAYIKRVKGDPEAALKLHHIYGALSFKRRRTA